MVFFNALGCAWLRGAVFFISSIRSPSSLSCDRLSQTYDGPVARPGLRIDLI
jgi:hypothetical protein